MAIGSFVNGVFEGMEARDTMENNKRLRKMEDAQFEREGEKHGWDKAKHELAMERARRGLKPKPLSAYEAVAAGYDAGGGNYGVPQASTPRTVSPAGSPFANPIGNQGGSAPLSYGSAVPREMSINQAIPAAAQPQQVAQGPMEFDYVPGRGIVMV